MNEIEKLLNEKAAIPLWPETGTALGLGRQATYSAARTGQIKTIRFGRLLRVPTAWLKAKLEIGQQALPRA